MGFGWLFIGYFFAYIMSVYEVLSFAMLAGFPMILMGLYKLAPYHTAFRSLFYYSFASLPFALYFGVYGFSQLTFSEMGGIFVGGFLDAVTWCYFGFSLLFHALLLYAVAQLAAELKLFSIQSAAWRNMILTMLYYLVDLVARLPFLSAYQGYFALPVILLRVITIFLNIYLIYQCYRHICSEEENNRPATENKGKEKKKKNDET